MKSMDDLIYRAEAIEKAKHDYDFFKGASNVLDKVRGNELLNVIFWLGNLPSVDAVPVVRCKDCAYCVIDPADGLPYCPEFYERTVELDDFCSRAVRR